MGGLELEGADSATPFLLSSASRLAVKEDTNNNRQATKASHDLVKIDNVNSVVSF